MKAEVFTWRGEPIPDIRVWCAQRGESLVHYHAERHVPSLWPTIALMVKEEYEGAMPESFWQGLAMTGGWCYTELRREACENTP